MAYAESDRWPAIIYGTAWKRDATAGLVQQAISAGFRAIDTANQPRHYHEPGVGEGIAAGLAAAGLGRDDLFLQTKFTPLDGQGSEVPYDPDATLEEQVEQSLQGSLEHLGASCLDSYLLHGPHNPRHLMEEDRAIWAAMEKIYRRGDVKRIGVSNVGSRHLQALLAEASIKPMVVQNRCFAQTGWNRDVRALCIEHDIAYQGFSLLTANAFLLQDPRVLPLAAKHHATAEQLLFAFTSQLGITPLTGTTSAQHMADDLAALAIRLEPEAIATLEGIDG